MTETDQLLGKLWGHGEHGELEQLVVVAEICFGLAQMQLLESLPLLVSSQAWLLPLPSL